MAGSRRVTRGRQQRDADHTASAWRVTDRAELSDLFGDLFGELFGELSVHHHYVRVGDWPLGDELVEPASLGAPLGPESFNPP